MKRIRIVVIAFFVFCFSLPTIWAQNTSTQGKEFWLSFMHNGFKDHDLGGWVINQVLISAKRDCSGTVSNPLTGWTTEFTVSANNITTVEIPEEQGYHNGSLYEEIANNHGCIRTIDKYKKIAMDAAVKYPLPAFLDEKSLDYETGLLKDDATVNVIFIGFGDVNRQLFLTYVATNQFIKLEDGKPVHAPVNYHIFDMIFVFKNSF